MKKNILIAIALLIVISTWAQKGKVNAAQFSLSEGKTNEAKQLIDEALLDAEVQQTVKAWQLKGDIYKSIYEGKVFFTQAPNALEVAKAAYLKAYELEINPKKKNAVVPSLEQLNAYFFNEGLSLFEQEKWAESFTKFKEATSTNDFLIQNKLSTKIDTSAYFASSLAAANAGLTEEAKPLLEKLVSYQYNNKAVYETLVDIYEKEKNPKFLETLNNAIKKFPDSKSLQVSKMNYYIANNKTDEAIKEIESALKVEPNNTSYLFNMAVLKEQLKQYQDAKSYYDKVIQLKPDFSDAYYNAGAMYFNKAIELNKIIGGDNMKALDSTMLTFLDVDIVSLDDIKAALTEQNLGALLNSFQNYANDKKTLGEKIAKINENIKYELLQAKRNALYSKALPYFETAYGKDKSLTNLKVVLKEIYARTNQYEKIKALD